ncbi:MAG: SGNH/GDSL hydrolase family protein [Planctomycetota bacterium]
MDPSKQRWAVSIVCTLIAAAVGSWILVNRSGRLLATTVGFREPSEPGTAVDVQLVPAADFFRVDEAAPIPATAVSRHFYLSQAAVESFWGGLDRQQPYDPWTYVWSRGGRDETFAWPEHPRGRWHLTTNRDGLREVGDPLGKRCDLRVLAVGDSHAFGVCDTDETFATVLESLLTRSSGSRSVEVLNAAQPGFDAFNYLGALHRFLRFEPQVFVVLFFGGNDLLSPLDMYYRFTREPIPPAPPNEKRRRSELIGHAPNAFGQCYEGAHNLLAHPEQGELAARVNARLFAEMQSVCSRRGVRFVVVYLPSPCDLPWREPPAEIEKGRKLSGLPEDAGSGLAATEERFLGLLATLSIEVIDLRASFRAQQDPPYWRKDLHINLDGQRLVAEALAPLVESVVSGR